MTWVSTRILQYFGQELEAKIKEMFVRKEEGKGLSTNDYTQEEKEKIATIEAVIKNTDIITLEELNNMFLDN